MLHEFLTFHREEIIARARHEVGRRADLPVTEAALEHGVPLFLDQLAETLRREQGTSARRTSGAMAESAVLHGGELRKAGFTLAQVVHGYGDVCQAVTALAMDLDIGISPDEFKALNRCLDEAIAQTVTEFARRRDMSVLNRGTERQGFFVHELRNLLGNSLMALHVLKTGRVGIAGSMGALLERNLLAMRDLIACSVAEVQTQSRLQRREHVPLAQLLADVEQAAAIEANARNVQFTLTSAEPGTMIDVDRQLIAAALANLLQNAFKFSRPGGQVVLRTDTTTAIGRVLIEVEDSCGGLPPGAAEDLFRPFQQRNVDRSGLGLGLAIARASVQANDGEVRARNLPGKGCVFTVDLPRVASEVPTATADFDADPRFLEPPLVRRI